MGRADFSKLAGGAIDGGDALDLDVLHSDDACGRWLGRERAGGAGGSFDVEEAEELSVGGVLEAFGISVELFGEQMRPGAAGGAGRGDGVDVHAVFAVGLSVLAAVGEEGEGGGVRRPGEAAFVG